jgi:hypothetical protein
MNNAKLEVISCPKHILILSQMVTVLRNRLLVYMYFLWEHEISPRFLRFPSFEILFFTKRPLKNPRSLHCPPRLFTYAFYSDFWSVSRQSESRRRKEKHNNILLITRVIISISTGKLNRKISIIWASSLCLCISS